MLRNKNFQSYNSGNNWKKIVTTLIKRTAVTKSLIHEMHTKSGAVSGQQKYAVQIYSMDVQYRCTDVQYG
jgi:hypothetical protein